jgi:hypothetical protein
LIVTKIRNYPGLIKAGEEGAELAQALLKCTLYPNDFEPVDGNELYEKVVEELGDAYAAVIFTMDRLPKAFYDRVVKRSRLKVSRFEEYEKQKVEGWCLGAQHVL